MIKGGLFGKLLKQFFIIGLISCFILLGNSFANAGTIGYIGESSTSIYSSDYTILVNGRGNLLTQYFGLGKRLLQFNKGNYFFRSTNSKPYMYVSSVVNGELKNPFQGYVQSYFLCDFIGLGSGSAYPSNCTKYSIDNGDYSSVIRIIGSLNNDGYFYYNSYGCSNSYGKYQQSLDVCFSSSQFNRSVCFYGGTPQEFDAGYSCNGSNGLGGNFYTHQGSQNIYASNLNGSLGLSAFFDQIDSSYLGGSPAGNSEIPDGDLTNISCPTIQQLINNYNSKGFSSGLCYSSNKIFNGSSFVSVESQSIFDLFSSKEDYLTALQGFSTYCESSVYNSSVCVDYFTGQDLRFNIISKLPKDLDVVGGRKQLYTYCNLYNYDPNATTCVASGVTAEVGTEITNQDVIHSLANGNYTIVSPVTNNTEYNTVFNNGEYEYTGDIITNIQNLFGKFTSLFKQQTGNIIGILPPWILIPFIIIVLFKLFKK